MLRMGGVMCCGSCVVTSKVVYVCVCRLADVSANRHTQTHRLLALQASRVWHVSLSFSTVHGGKGGGGGEGGEDGEGGEGVAKAAEATMLCVGAVCRRRQSGRDSQISIFPYATTCRGGTGPQTATIRIRDKIKIASPELFADAALELENLDSLLLVLSGAARGLLGVNMGAIRADWPEDGKSSASFL